MARWRARLAAEAIAYFNTYASDDQEPTSSYDLPASMGAVYLSNIVARHARHAREHRGIRPSVVCMVNDSSILVVSQAGRKHYLSCSPVCNDGFGGGTCYDLQKTCA